MFIETSTDLKSALLLRSLSSCRNPSLHQVWVRAFSLGDSIDWMGPDWSFARSMHSLVLDSSDFDDIRTLMFTSSPLPEQNGGIVTCCKTVYSCRSASGFTPETATPSPFA